MSKTQHYTYAILRYRHDAMIGESLNVGVALFSQHLGRFEYRFTTKFSRLKAAFPTLDGDAYRNTISAISRGLKQFEGFSPSMVSPSANGVREIVEQVLRQDDSSFHWSEIGEGVSLDIEDEIEYLFRRFVTWHEEVNPSRRTDSDIWRPVREALRKKKLSRHFTTTTIVSASTHVDVKFQNAWKNGRWHVFQPLSLDLKTEDGIQDKVMKWSGYLLNLQDQKNEFKPYFLLGKPTSQKLESVYEEMIQVLEKSPCDPVVYTEESTQDLIDYIEVEINTHENNRRMPGLS